MVAYAVVDHAIGDFDKAIQLNPDDALAYHNRANSYYFLGQYQNAINDFTKVIQLDPDYAWAAWVYNNRGFSYSALGQPALADADKTMACSLASSFC